MNIRRGFFRHRLLITFFALFILGALAYAAITVYTARRETTAVVRRALGSEKMRLKLDEA